MNLITELKKEELKELEKTGLYGSITIAVQKYGIREDVLDFLKQNHVRVQEVKSYNTSVFLEFVKGQAGTEWIDLYLKVSKEKNFSYAAEVLSQFQKGTDIKKVQEAYKQTRDLFDFHNYMEQEGREKEADKTEKTKEVVKTEKTELSSQEEIYSEAITEIMETSVIPDEDIEVEEMNNFHDKLLTMASRACEEYRQKEATIKEMNKILKIQNGIIKKQEDKICDCEKSMELKDIEINELRKELDDIRHRYETLSSKVFEVSALQTSLSASSQR